MKNSKLKMMTVLFFIGSTLTLMAQDMPKREHHEKGQKEWKGKSDHRSSHGMIPNLTDEQKEKMKALRLSFQKETLPLKNELNEKRAEMRTLTTVDSPDMKKVNKLIEEMGAIEVKMMKARVANKQQVREQLTEEQRIAFDSHPWSGMRRGRN